MDEAFEWIILAVALVALATVAGYAYVHASSLVGGTYSSAGKASINAAILYIGDGKYVVLVEWFGPYEPIRLITSCGVVEANPVLGPYRGFGNALYAEYFVESRCPIVGVVAYG